MVIFARLPSIAVPSVLYITRFISLLQSPEWQCPSTGDLFAMGPDLRALEWQTRLRELQGILLLAGASQAILGFSGKLLYFRSFNLQNTTIKVLGNSIF